MERVIQELIYGYVRDRQLCTRAIFVSKHPHPVLVYRQVQVGAIPDTQQMPVLSQDLQAAVRVMRRDAHQYRVFPLEHDRLTLGRGTDNDVDLADASVSKAHGHVERSAHGFAVVDHGSRNGSKLEGRTLAKDQSTLLSDGDIIHFGNVKVRYLSPGALFDFLTTLLDPRATPGG